MGSYRGQTRGNEEQVPTKRLFLQNSFFFKSDMGKSFFLLSRIPIIYLFFHPKRENISLSRALAY